MTRIKHLAAVAAVVTTASCGDVVRQGRSPVFLSIDFLGGSRGATSPGPYGSPLLSDVITLVRSPAPCTASTPCPTTFNDLGQVTLRATLKDIGTPASPSSASTNNEVTINRFRIVYRRADGRNTPGTDVPFGFDGAVTGTVRVGAQTTLGFEMVRHTAKYESPLVQLISNGLIITSLADITFYGTDRVGNEISVTGSIQIDFGDFGDF